MLHRLSTMCHAHTAACLRLFTLHADCALASGTCHALLSHTIPHPTHPPRPSTHTHLHSPLQIKAAPKQVSPLLARLPSDKRLAVELVKGMYFEWKGPMETLDKAGKAFLGLEALLGGSGFEVQGNIWRRQVGVGV